MFPKALGLVLVLLAPLASHANGDCTPEERAALAVPGMRPDLKGLQMADVQVHSTTTLKERVQLAEHATATPAATLYGCLAKAELQRREGGNNTTVADDPKARGRSARVM